MADLQSLKLRLQNLNPTEINELQRTYHYRWIKSLLGSTGWLNIFLGGFTFWLGLSGVDQNVLKVIQALLGAITIAQSLSSIISPTTAAILRFSLLFLAAGMWNIFVGARDNFDGLALFTGILGILQLWWAFSYYRVYQKYAPMTLTKPSLDTSTAYDEIWGILAKTKNGVAEFIRLQMRYDWWQGLLLKDLAVLAHKRSKMVIFANEQDVAFTPVDSKAISKRRVKGHIKLDTVTSSTTIPQEFFEKYVQWKSMDDDKKQQWLSEAHSVVQGFQIPSFIRIPLLIIGSLVLLYIVFIIIGVISLILKYR